MRLFHAIIFFFAGAACLSGALSAHAAQTWSEEKMAAEELYARFGDERCQITQAEAVRLLHKLANDERRQRGLQTLGWDFTAAKAALEHTDEMAKYRYLSHLNLSGEKPNQRYNRLGGTNQVSENVSYRESSLRLYLTPQLVEDIHQRWMSSPPHRKNLLTPTHNAVGIAISLRWDGIRSVLTAAQELVGDYGVAAKLPHSAAFSDKLDISGEMAGRDLVFQYMTVGWEPLPERQTPKGLNASLNGYSLPKPFIVLMASSDEYSKAVKGFPNIYPISYQPSRGRYSARLSINSIYEMLKDKTGSGKPRPGLYYFMVWVSHLEAQPFIASTQVVRVMD